MNFAKSSDELLFLDGGMGTMLMPYLKPGQPNITLNLTNPEAIRAVHTAYFEAGSDIVYANTFRATEPMLGAADWKMTDAVQAAVTAAKEAAQPYHGLVGLDVGSIGTLYKPQGDLSFEEAYQTYAKVIMAGAAAGVDVIAVETMTDLYDAKAAVLAAKENCDLPVFCTLAFESNMRTYMGCPVEGMALVMEGLGADAIGINCSLGPIQILPIAERLLAYTSLPVIIKPNAGLPVVKDGQPAYDITAEQFVEAMLAYPPLGIWAVGGCCGTTPDYIRLLRRSLEGVKPAARIFTDRSRVICSGTRLANLDECPVTHLPYSPNMDDVMDAALDYMADGADVLEVELPEKPTAAASYVQELQGIVGLPFLFTGDAAAVAAAKRVYNGHTL